MTAADLGRLGEDIACRYLEEELDLVVLGRNWRCGHGELDVIATDKWEELRLMQHSATRSDGHPDRS